MERIHKSKSYKEDESFPIIEIVNYRFYGECILQTWKRQGTLHADDMPALTVRDLRTNQLYLEEWYQNGELHRDDEPARTLWSAGLESYSESFHQNGLRHNENAPAYFLKKTDGTVLKEAWFHEGKKHRLNAPCKTVWDEKTGNIEEQEWAVQGEPYREGNLPVVTEFCPITGVVVEELYYHNGKWDASKTIRRDENSGDILGQKPFDDFSPS